MEPPSLDGDAQSPTISPISDSNINDPLLDPMGDDLSHDWAQWMHWDDHEHVDSISDHVDGTISSRNLSWDENQLMRSLEGERKVPISSSSPNAPIPQQQTACPSAISPVSMGNLDLPLDRAGCPGTIRQIPVTNLSPNRMPVGGGLGSPVSPQSTVPANRKRKSSSEDDRVANVGVDSKKLPAKKRSHNVIEKRYRANLNDKIAELRDSVPSLRIAASAQQKGGSSLGDEDDGTGGAPANKLNKASILSKATAYIQHLELRNRRLDEENLALKARLRQQDRALGQNVTTSSGSVSSPCTVSTESGTGSSPSVFSHVEESLSGESTSKSLYPPEGLLKVPEYFKQFRTTEPQPHYADTQVEYQNTECDRPSGGGKRRRGNFPNKFMVGALAGIMIVEGLGKQRQTESTEKGLFAIPLQFVKGLQFPSIRSLQYALFNSRHVWALLGFGITFTLVFFSAFLVFLYLFNARPLRQKQPSKAARGTAVASSNEFRQQAWLTSIQTVGVPSHTFFPEWYAVTSRCFEYCLRRTLGWSLYSWLTGITEDDEKGRVKAWDIAIDAQLTGGDSEISKSRLVLTVFASGTLPASPARIMLKALHCRILLYMVGSPGSFSFRASNKVGSMIASYQWKLARQVHESWPKDDPEVLPPHVEALLEVDCDDVMMDSITQRASNMTWSRPTQEATQGDEALLDVVAEDTSIRSPLDALAAWWSCHNLQKGLVEVLDSGSSFPLCTESQKNLHSSIDIAINTAPPTSAPYTRALAAKAIFSDENRSKNISSVLAALPSTNEKSNDLPPNPCKSINFVDSSTPVSVRSEIGHAARCAIIIAILKRESMRDMAFPASKAKQKAIALFNAFPLDPVDLTLLGFVSIYYLLHVVASDELRVTSHADSSPSNNTSSTDDDEKPDSLGSSTDTLKYNRPIPRLDRVASGLVYWIRHAYGPASYGFTTDLVKKVEEGCYTICRSVGIELIIDEKKKAKKRNKSKSKSAKQEDEKDVAPEKARRESMKSNDTGYGSLGECDGVVQEKTRSLDPIEDIDQG